MGATKPHPRELIEQARALKQREYTVAREKKTFMFENQLSKKEFWRITSRPMAGDPDHVDGRKRQRQVGRRWRVGDSW